MTRDEVARSVTMRDVLRRYGLEPNRAGFISCPFHMGDRTPSMKIYAGSFHCFGCGADGDIFDFVQRMDNCGFREAFLALGGTYDREPGARRRREIYQARKAAETRRNRREREKRRKAEELRRIDRLREDVRKAAPMSDAWCAALAELQRAEYRAGMYDEQ